MFLSLLPTALLAAPLASAGVLPLQSRSSALRHFDAAGSAPSLKWSTPKAFAKASPNSKTENYIKLERATVKTPRSAILRAVGNTTTVGSGTLENAGGIEYLVPIEFGSQKFTAILDTGSSDTWLIAENFKCVDQTGKAQDKKTCNFGPGFKGDFGKDRIPNLNFNISYGDGEFVTGDFGYQDVTIAGIKVPKQEVALGDFAFWNGDGQSSGLVGLAYPGITSAFQGDEPTAGGARAQYDPLFTNMYKQKLSSPMFSLALQRGQNGGYIAFGGLPPVDVAESDFATAKIETLSLGSRASSGLTFYAMTPDAVGAAGAGAGAGTGGGSKGGKNGTATVRAGSNNEQYIVDSGTTLNYLPSALAKQLNSQFSPKAKLQSGAYLVDCNAKPPAFSVTVGGKSFAADPQDLIIKDQPDKTSGLCITGFQDGGSGPFILGDAWMKSVVVVFDVGASEMRFASHKY